MKTHLIIGILTVATSGFTLAKKTHSGRTTAYSPEEQLAGFSVPEGFIVELVASENDGIVNPIDLTFDSAGRLWTQTARMYPLDPVSDIHWADLLRLMDDPEGQAKDPDFKRIKDLYSGKTKGTDDILVLSNIYGKTPPTVTQWATGLAIPQSILPYKNGAYVAQGSELFFLEDTNGDGAADKRTPLLTGFGFTDTHTMAHSLVRAPGGWINFSHGALNKGKVTAIKSGESTHIDFSKIARFTKDGNQIELVNAGLNNIWGLQLRSNGQWFMTEANDHGQSVTPAEPLTAYKGIGNEKLRDYQPFFPPPHKFRVGGTGISGLAFADDSSNTFPEEYRNVAFLANPITSTINCVHIVRNPDGSVTAKHLPDLLQSKDDWFRPVNIEFGPDGCLYVADWYNKIVSHNEVATSHPDRDKSHGRIWRIRHQSQQPRSIPNLYKASNNALLKHLKSPSLWEARSAAFELIDRQAKELAPELTKLAIDSSQHQTTRIHALWSLEGLNAFEQNTWSSLLKDPDADIRREAVRALVNIKPDVDLVHVLIAPLAKDPHVMVRSQVIRTLEKLGAVNQDTIKLLVSFCHPPAPNNTLGSGYEQNFERYLARRALERYPPELQSFLNSTAAKEFDSDHLLWAQQALEKQSTDSFLVQWESLKKKPLSKDSLLAISDLCDRPKVRSTVAPYFRSTQHARDIAKLSLQHIEEVYSVDLGFPLAETALTLLKSNSADQLLAVELARAYRITHIHQSIAALLQSSTDNALRAEVIRFLAHIPKPHAKTLAHIAADTNESNDLRLAALSAYVQAAPAKAEQLASQCITNEPQNKTLIISQLGNTVQGCKVLVTLVTNKDLTADDIPHTIAQRMHDTSPQDQHALAIYHHASAKRKTAEQAAKARLPKLANHIKENQGNASVGKAIFTGLCLSCHVVGEEGANIAPALDGSANRDLEHLLTAILLPDEAAEGAYVLFRVTESSGHMQEGYLVKQSERGTTLATQGGKMHFIPHRTISKQGHVASSSFMPSGVFDKLPDKVIADLVAYIETLK